MCIRDSNNPELREKDAILSEYVSEVNGIHAKFAVYETIGYASAYFVDNGILYSISVSGFAEEAVSYTHLDVYKRQRR